VNLKPRWVFVKNLGPVSDNVRIVALHSFIDLV